MFKCNFSKIKGFKCGEKGRMFWKWQIQCRYSALGVFLSFFFLLYACFFVFKKKNYANISCRNGETSRSVTMTT